MKRSEKEWIVIIYNLSASSWGVFYDLCGYTNSQGRKYRALDTWLASLSAKRQEEAWKQIQAHCTKKE